MADEAAEGIAPTLLLAMPQLLDPNFHRSVVLLCKHNDEGALGFVVNRPVETTLTELLSLDPPPAAGCNLSVWQGGPVSQERGWLLCRSELAGGEGFEVCDGIYMSTSQAMLRRVLDGNPRECEPDRSRLLLGYAGWGPGQLEDEIGRNAWLTLPASADVIFDVPVGQRLARAFGLLGIDPAFLSSSAGHA